MCLKQISGEHEFYENKSGSGKAGSETILVIQVQNECVSVCVLLVEGRVGHCKGGGGIDKWTDFLTVKSAELDD